MLSNFRNLLLPDGVPAERPKARIVVKIYKAEGLPKSKSDFFDIIISYPSDLFKAAIKYSRVPFLHKSQNIFLRVISFFRRHNVTAAFTANIEKVCIGFLWNFVNNCIKSCSCILPRDGEYEKWIILIRENGEKGK